MIKYSVLNNQNINQAPGNKAVNCSGSPLGYFLISDIRSFGVGALPTLLSPRPSQTETQYALLRKPRQDTTLNTPRMCVCVEIIAQTGQHTKLTGFNNLGEHNLSKQALVRPSLQPLGCARGHSRFKHHAGSSIGASMRSRLALAYV